MVYMAFGPPSRACDCLAVNDNGKMIAVIASVIQNAFQTPTAPKSLARFKVAGMPIEYSFNTIPLPGRMYYLRICTRIGCTK